MYSRHMFVLWATAVKLLMNFAWLSGPIGLK